MPDQLQTRHPRISVVVPAYNAAATLDETLRSARSQTCFEIEIIVVDDGSSDATAGITRSHAARDPRVRLHSQANAGVAAARNAGTLLARAQWVAFLDADDLWAPIKLEKQLAAVNRIGPECALAYTRFCLIDSTSAILLENVGGIVEGRVFADLCRGNFIGNGSSPLIRRDALLEAGGFDAGLRASGAQGCEDYKLYLQLAERWSFAVVAEPLIGYRLSAHNMSADILCMYRSFAQVSAETARRHPGLRNALRQGRVRYLQHLIHRSRGRWLSAPFLIAAARLFAMSPGRFIGTLLLLGRSQSVERISRGRFVIGDPDHGPFHKE